MELSDKLRALALSVEQEIKKVKSLDQIGLFEIRFLGRKGELANLLREVTQVPSEERQEIGLLANAIKQKIENIVLQMRTKLFKEDVERRLEIEREDITESGIKPPQGHLHVVSQAIREITDIFSRAGFVRTRYPEVDFEWYAFSALNMPEDHPARDEWETFFIDAPALSKWGRMVLTPHATNGTARNLTEKTFPIRSINISKTYRRQIDITHVPMFHQFDGVYVDKGVGITHLLGILDYFVKNFFGAERSVRIRPFHFRFTEPSFEIDISCGVCGGTGVVLSGKCRTCKRGWMELGGCGMLHPNVMKAAGIDPNEYSGAAFGWGVERTYMMKEGLKMDDIRILYKNDLRFLQQL